MGSKFLPARTAGIAGILFFVGVAIPGFVSGGPPDGSDPAAKFLTYYQSNRSALIVSDFLATVATFFALFFFAKLITTLRRAEGEPGTLSVAAIIAISMVATMATIGGVISAATAFRVGGAEHIDAVTLVALNDASNIVFVLLGIPLAAFFVAQGYLIIATKQLPQWLGILMLVAATLEALGSLAILSTSGFFSPNGASGFVLSLLPLGVVVIATSIVMLARPARFDGAVATTAPAPLVATGV
jgi:hypothetical protein